MRNRWVVYNGAAQHWRNQEPSTVPPEWHGWLHYITDANPTNVSAAVPSRGFWVWPSPVPCQRLLAAATTA